MVRLSDLPPKKAEQLSKLPLPSFATMPWVEGPPLVAARLAVVSTAGIHLPDERPFHLGEAGYRTIPGDVDLTALVMSHVSPNFDRTGFEADPNVVFPLDRLKEMEGDGGPGSLAVEHYSFMGATDPRAMEPDAGEIASRMKDDGVNAVLLVPV
jgi:D-proline reductase (dithiol) PrdB